MQLSAPHTTTLGFRILLLTFLATTIGCADDGKYPVSGTVTWEGDLIPADQNGFVTLMPVDASVAPDAGPIEADSTFSFRASPGDKRVEIMISRPVGKKVEAMGMAAQEQYLPERYNEKTELTTTIVRGNNKLKFELVK